MSTGWPGRPSCFRFQEYNTGMKTALLLIDIQNDYFPGGKMELEGADTAAAQARRLLDLFRQQAWPTVHIQHIATRPGSTFFLPDTDGAAIHASIAPLPGETVIVKHFPNSFRETNLLEHLRGLGIERLVICGMMTHMCIDATTRAAFDHGFSCTLAHDACATRNLSFGDRVVAAEQVHLAFLAALSAIYAKVVGTAEVIGALC
jgi:nicotinamidase-related amidase